MLRSLISLLLLANLNAGTLLPGMTDTQSSFTDTDLLEVNHVPVKDHNAIQPEIEAKSALVMDVGSGAVLFEKDSHKQMSMASLTKIMTALLILESHDLDEVVTVDENYAAMGEDKIGVKIWLKKGEKMTVGNLLIALLVRSAGDAALTLAKYHSGSVEEFVNDMNEKAQILNLKNTHFTNPIGMDNDDHYSSAFDLAILTKCALRFPAFRNIIKMKEAEITSMDGLTKHSFETTNYLLYSYLDIEGVKTGTTDTAGESVINLARSPDGHEIIAIVLNSPDRFQENKSIIDWVFRSYTW
jgi:serine-type D-Ala-D-Ala carboxypeptidase (penicillin-binding protein 5/6)